MRTLKTKEEIYQEIRCRMRKALKARSDISGLSEPEQWDVLKTNGLDFLTLFEFRTALFIAGFSQADIASSLNHENAHANKAQSLDALFHCYKFYMAKEDGKNMFQPSAFIGLPKYWSNEKKRQAWKLITRAPEEYGDELSVGDYRKLAIL